MAYPSVDHLQNLLAKEVFHYTKDAKKAAGRALGTLVEIIAFYCLKSWGLEQNIAIERPLPEFANDDITHNVEYTLHPSRSLTTVSFDQNTLPLTARKILNRVNLADYDISGSTIKSNTLLSKELVLRNACTLCDLEDRFLNGYLDGFSGEQGQVAVALLRRKPFAIVECKRVGIEEGMRKGPQTIEKAKQGAYVARSVSSLQKVRLIDGKMGGLIQKQDGSFHHGDYFSLLAEIIKSADSQLLTNFVLTIGVVSNHGNWFTSENHNKELKVLSQSYDWLLFLSDAGIAQFIDEVLLHPDARYKAARDAFLSSYTGKKGCNQFTKVKISLEADTALQAYYARNIKSIEGWFNIISPAKNSIATLRKELNTLKNKPWEDILS
jgi:hypothetical protein